MMKKLFLTVSLFVALVFSVAGYAAVDVNKASAADLDSVKGIGPSTSEKILSERKKGNFKDWNDFINRVPGIGEKRAANLSTSGLTVGGKTYKAEAASTADKKSTPTAKPTCATCRA